MPGPSLTTDCPECKHRNLYILTTDPDAGCTRPGEHSVCINCMSVLRCTDDGRLRPIGRPEINLALERGELDTEGARFLHYCLDAQESERRPLRPVH